MTEKRIARCAYSALRRGDYSEALWHYRQLANRIHEKHVEANLELARKRLPRLHGTQCQMPTELSVDTICSTVCLATDDAEFVDLNERPRYFRVSIPDNRKVHVKGRIRYSTVHPGDDAMAIASFEFYDQFGGKISGPFKGLASSRNHGDHVRLRENSTEDVVLFTVCSPIGAVEAIVMLSAVNVAAHGKIQCSSVLRSQCEPIELGDILQPMTDELSILGWPELRDNGQIRMMSIFDEFSRECFAPHANLIEPRPDNAKALVARDNPELLFVESTWRGNKSTWQYRVAKYANPPGKELASLVTECRKRHIPTVFWNKEDPVHFNNFSETAQLFDYIFTTAVEAVPRYQALCDAKVRPLPFAAETTLHNPVGSSQRNRRVCFAGSYYANRFEDRRNEQLMLLDVASRFSLDIYDRNAGMASSDFCFPARFSPYVRGSLTYAEVNKAYREYRVFLNVNSIIDSKTMFSRRVFELLACGTPVVSTVSEGIDSMFGKDLVWTVRNQAEAEDAMHQLMSNDSEWRRRSILGIRTIFARHTFAHRFEEVLQNVGLHQNILPQRRVLMVGEVTNQSEADLLIETCRRQKLVRTDTRLLIISTGGNVHVSADDDIRLVGPDCYVKPLLKKETAEWMATHVSLLDPKVVYGAYFIQDSLNALSYSGSSVTGKPHTAVDTYDYSKALAHGSLVFQVDWLSGTDGSISELNAFERNCLLKVRHTNDVFAADAANYVAADQMSGQKPRKLIDQIEI